MIRSRWKRILITSSLAGLCTLLVTAETSAQQKKKRATTPKKTVSTKTTTRPASPAPVLSGAEIISRSADDYAQPTVMQPVQETTVDRSAAVANPDAAAWIRDLQDRINKLEASTAKKETYEDRQKRLLLNLDILTRAEQRSEALRKQIFELTDKENSLKTRLDQIDYESRPEVIERVLQMSGSLRPEEIRDAQRKKLLAEKSNLQSLLESLQNTKATLQANLDKADEMVVKLRDKLEKDIDDSFLKDKPNDQ